VQIGYKQFDKLVQEITNKMDNKKYNKGITTVVIDIEYDLDESLRPNRSLLKQKLAEVIDNSTHLSPYSDYIRGEDGLYIQDEDGNYKKKETSSLMLTRIQVKNLDDDVVSSLDKRVVDSCKESRLYKMDFNLLDTLRSALCQYTTHWNVKGDSIISLRDIDGEDVSLSLNDAIMIINDRYNDLRYKLNDLAREEMLNIIRQFLTDELGDIQFENNRFVHNELADNNDLS